MTIKELQIKVSRWTKAFTGFVTEAAKAVASLFVATFPWSLVLVIIVAVALFIALILDHDTSENEKKAEDARISTIVEDANTNVQANKVEESEKSVKEAEKSSQNARKEREKANKTDSSANGDRDAQKRFCERFPNDSTCQK